MLLAIDTATSYSSLALHDGQQLVAEDTWRSRAQAASAELAPAVQNLLSRSGVVVADLTGLAVCIGPGSYSGLRVGVALAKGIAAALALPLVGISSLDILAAGHPQAAGGLIALVQAGRGRVVAAAYQWRKGRWKPRGEALLMTWDTLVASIDGPATVTGEIDNVGLTALLAAQAANIPVTLAPPAHRLRRAGFLAEEAWSRLRQQPDDVVSHDPAQVVPLYVKTKEMS
jgi:tRNA threonylcarbamoyladenosine biosynthesis protein TsaB